MAENDGACLILPLHSYSINAVRSWYDESNIANCGFRQKRGMHDSMPWMNRDLVYSGLFKLCPDIAC